MNLYQYSFEPAIHNEDQNPYSDDTDSEEQKMLEMEALLYSKVHYAEDLSCIADAFQETERLSNDCHNAGFDRKKNSNHALEKPDNLLDKASEEESDIATSIFNEILNAKKSNHRTTPDLESDSGMSSGKDAGTPVVISMKNKARKNKSLKDSTASNKSYTPYNVDLCASDIDTDNIKSDSKYTNRKFNEKSKQTLKDRNPCISLDASQNVNQIIISSSDTEASSDEDSGIRVIKQVDKNNKDYPLIDLESEDESCDDATHSKFLESIQGMDACQNTKKALVEKSINNTSSDSEIELLPNTSGIFSCSKKQTTSLCSSSKTDRSCTIPAPPLKIVSDKESSTVTSQLKRKVTVIHHEDSRKKLPPKNVVSISSNTDSSSSDEDNILKDTSISLNVIGGNRNINQSSTYSRDSFEKIICQEDNPLSANVREQCSMLNISRDEVVVKNWTPEMYKFYNEVNKIDGN